MPPLWRTLKARRKRYGALSQAQLDREYSPSSCVDDIQVYLDRYEELSQRARWRAQSQSACYLDLSWGTGARQSLDLFLPFEKKCGPLLVYIHGGFWQMLSKNESSFAATMVQNHAGYFASLGYTLAPEATLADIVEENRRALVWLYQHGREYGLDRERIYLAGSSAGAHLAAMMLLTDWPAYGMPRDLIKGACAVSGVYDLEPVRLSYVNEPLNLNEHDVLELSPVRHMLSNHASVVLACGDNETAEFKRQTELFYEHLMHAGEQVVLREITGRNHFDVILDLCDDESWLGRAVLEMMGLVDAERPGPD